MSGLVEFSKSLSVSKSMVKPGVFKPISELSRRERKQVLGAYKQQRAMKVARDTKPNASYEQAYGKMPKSLKAANYVTAKLKRKPVSIVQRQNDELVRLNEKFGDITRARKPEIERNYTKLKSNVYTKDSTRMNRAVAADLPKMRRPVVLTSDKSDLPMKLPNAVGGAVIPTGGKSTPKVMYMNPKIVGMKDMEARHPAFQKIFDRQKAKVSPIIRHEAAHANAKNTISTRLKAMARPRNLSAEEGRADRVSGAVNASSYKTMHNAMRGIPGLRRNARAYFENVNRNV